MKEEQNSSTIASQAGTPRPEVARQLEALYAPRKEPEDFEEAAPRLPITREISEPVKTVELTGVSTADRKLLDRLKDHASSLTIKVNQVELTLEVIDVSRTETSICCLVRKNGMRCKIPPSQNVEIELEGLTYHTAFLGSWHTLDWLGLHVVVFPMLPEVLEAGGNP